MSITNPTEGRQYLAQAIRDSQRVDTIGDTVSFIVKVISPPVPMSSADVALAFPSEEGPVPSVSRELQDRLQFQGRIERGYFMSPHIAIPDPCDIYAASDTKIAAYQSLHLTCITPKGFNEPLKIGDRVRVTCRKGDFKMDLQFANVDSLETSFITEDSFFEVQECSDLSEKFKYGDFDLSLLGDLSTTSIPDGAPVRDRADLIFEAYSQGPAAQHVTREFAYDLVRIADESGLSPFALANVIHYESGLTWSPATISAGTTPTGDRAVGLIQLLPNRAGYIGYTPEQLKNMSAIEQLRGPVRDWIRYVSDQRGGYSRARWWDAYLLVYDWSSVGQGLSDGWLNRYVTKWPTVGAYAAEVNRIARLDPNSGWSTLYSSSTPSGEPVTNALEPAPPEPSALVSEGPTEEI